MARGFARVGGVLIGRAPEAGGTSASANSLAWTIVANRVTLRLGAAVPVSVRPVDASTVDAALRYAADGRVTTVTMTSAAPLYELKILLHPALEDTPAGNAAIELDRLVDTYARLRPEVQAEEQRIQAQYALYAAAWTYRQSVVMEQAAAENARAREAAVALRSRADRLLTGGRQALTAPAADLIAPRRSLVAARPAWFDKDLVRLIHDAAGRSADDWRERLLIRIREQVRGVLAHGEEGRSTLDGWFNEPAQFRVWSGVRERPWTADARFAFAGGGNGDPLWPFQFMLQASFVTPPLFGTPAPGEDAYEFDSVQPVIQAAVAQGIRSPAGDAAGHPAAVATMRDLALLQRLFRLALAGQLGPTFPIERLADLSAAVRSHRQVQATPRWNVRPGELERRFVEVLVAAREMAAIHPSLTPRLAGCLNGITSRPSAVAQERWEQVCTFTAEQAALARDCTSDRAVCGLSNAVGILDDLTRARRLRRELGVGTN